MLVVSRYPGEEIIITTPDNKKILVRLVSIRANKVRIGFEASEEIKINRKEVQDQIDNKDDDFDDSLG